MLFSYKTNSWPIPKCPNSLPLALHAIIHMPCFLLNLDINFFGGQLLPIWIPYVPVAHGHHLTLPITFQGLFPCQEAWSELAKFLCVSLLNEAYFVSLKIIMFSFIYPFSFISLLFLAPSCPLLGF